MPFRRWWCASQPCCLLPEHTPPLAGWSLLAPQQTAAQSVKSSLGRDLRICLAWPPLRQNIQIIDINSRLSFSSPLLLSASFLISTVARPDSHIQSLPLAANYFSHSCSYQFPRHEFHAPPIRKADEKRPRRQCKCICASQ